MSKFWPILPILITIIGILVSVSQDINTDTNIGYQYWYLVSFDFLLPSYSSYATLLLLSCCSYSTPLFSPCCSNSTPLILFCCFHVSPLLLSCPSSFALLLLFSFSLAPILPLTIFFHPFLALLLFTIFILFFSPFYHQVSKYMYMFMSRTNYHESQYTLVSVTHKYLACCALWRPMPMLVPKVWSYKAWNCTNNDWSVANR